MSLSLSSEVLIFIVKNVGEREDRVATEKNHERPLWKNKSSVGLYIL